MSHVQVWCIVGGGICSPCQLAESRPKPAAHHRVCPPLQVKMAVPPFDSTCAASLAEMRQSETRTWNKRTRASHSDQALGPVDVGEVLSFLQQRRDDDGRPLRELLGDPVDKGDGWFRLEVRGGVAACPHSEFEEAWHGTKFECLYAVLTHKCLFASGNSAWQGHTLGGHSGVYCFKPRLKHKTEFYSPWVQLVPRGVFWRLRLELRVRSSCRVPLGKNTDQWCFSPDGVCVAAIWVQGRVCEDMIAGDSFAEAWNPKCEMHPRRVPDNVLEENGRAPLQFNRSTDPSMQAFLAVGCRVRLIYLEDLVDHNGLEGTITALRAERVEVQLDSGKCLEVPHGNVWLPRNPEPEPEPRYTDTVLVMRDPTRSRSADRQTRFSGGARSSRG